MSNRKLRFEDLSTRHVGVTPGLSATFAEAARVCLERHHQSPQMVALHEGGAETRGTAEWQPADERTRNGWANDDDATEYGAYGLALAAVELTRGMVAVRRAERLTGADYYLGQPGAELHNLEASLRLEVSGTDEGSDAAIQ